MVYPKNLFLVPYYSSFISKILTSIVRREYSLDLLTIPQYRIITLRIYILTPTIKEKYMLMALHLMNNLIINISRLFRNKRNINMENDLPQLFVYGVKIKIVEYVK